MYCKGNHSANKCTVVVDPKIRKSIVLKLGLCYNCLSTSHLNAKRTSKYRCRHCGSKHHTTMCEKEGNQGDPPLEDGTLPPIDDPPQVQATLTPRQQTSAMHDYPIPLKTAISQVRAGNTSRDTNILLGEGTQRSFITTKLADELGAKPISKENIAMSVFGSTERSHRRLDVIMVDIITDNGDRIPLQVLLVPQITTPLNLNITQTLSTCLTSKD